MTTLCTDNPVAISQKRIGTFLRTFKPKLLLVGSNAGLIWLTDITDPERHNAICIGTCTTEHMVKLTVREFGKWVRAAGVKSEVTFSIDDDGFHAECDKLGRITFEASSHSKMSGPDGMNNLGDFVGTLPAETVASIGGIVNCTDSESTRYALASVCIEHNAAIATDGKRLAHLTIEEFGAPEFKGTGEFDDNANPVPSTLEWHALVPASVIKYAVSVGEPIDIFSRGVVAGDMRGQLIDGRFPNWRQVIPNNGDRSVTYDCVALREMADRQISLDKADDDATLKLSLEATDSGGKQYEVMADATYVKDACKGLDSVTFCWHEGSVKEPDTKQKASAKLVGRTAGRYLTAPILVTSDDAPGWKHVIMPMSWGR